MKCPGCDHSLEKEHYEQIEIERCPNCQGTWLDLKELLHIVENQEKDIPKDLIQSQLTKAFKGIPQEEIDQKRNCPHCHQGLRPVNYNYSSGIIIDQCSQHGIWLDHHELEKIQAHSDYWNQKAKESETKWRDSLSHIKEKEVEVEVSNFKIINTLLSFFN
jgi:uncharacterized protein